MGLSDQQKSRVLKQVEFYFSDSNLPYDKFLRGQIESATDSWVDLSVVVAFTRMQQVLQIQCKGPDDVKDETIKLVAEVLRTSELLEVSEDGFQIRRAKMPEDWDEVIRTVDARSVHAAPLPFNCTMETIGKFFAKWGAVNQVRMLRWPGSKLFKGCVIVEMGSQAEADALLAAAAVEFEGAALRVQSKPQYIEKRDKATAAEEDAETVDVDRPLVTAEGLPEAPEGEEEEEGEEEGDEAAADAAAAAAAAETPAVQYELGCVVKFELVGDVPEDVSGGALRAAMGGGEKGIMFVEFYRGQKDGKVRLKDPETAKELLAAVDGDGLYKFGDRDVQAKLSLLEGDEEREWWTQTEKKRAENLQRRGDRDGGRPNKRPKHR